MNLLQRVLRRLFPPLSPAELLAELSAPLPSLSVDFHDPIESIFGHKALAILLRPHYPESAATTQRHADGRPYHAIRIPRYLGYFLITPDGSDHWHIEEWITSPTDTSSHYCTRTIGLNLHYAAPLAQVADAIRTALRSRLTD